jgi:hypothetical protein
VSVENCRYGKAKGKRQEARVKRVWAILHFFTQFGFIVFTYLEVNSALPSQIKLQVNDKLGKQQPQEKAFAIAIIKKVEPTVPPPFILPAPQTTPVFPSF